MDDVVLPVPVSKIWASLSDFPYGGFQSGTWAECLAISKRVGNPLGELYLAGDAQTDDFKRVPISRNLRVVMMPQGEGFILRWLDPGEPSSVKLILGGIYHEYLLRSFEQFEEVRSGWMRVLDTGHLRIQS
jgi:hypothetical protein